MPVEVQFNNGDVIVIPQDPVDLFIRENDVIEGNITIILKYILFYSLYNIFIIDVGEGKVQENIQNSSQRICTTTPHSDSMAATPTTSDQSQTSNNMINAIIHQKSKTFKRPHSLTNLVWKKGSFVTDNACITHTELMLPADMLLLDTPLDYFAFFFSNDFLQKIKYQSELYSVQKNANKPVIVSIDELKKYIGICVYASIMHVPKVRDYWSADLGVPLIFNAMSRNRFELIRSILHFNDNSSMLSSNDPNRDRLHKLRPLIEHLNSCFSSVPCKQNLALDEQLCATKAHSYMKQYLPDKPHKWGFKLFVLTDIQGFAYNFEIYSGQENETRFRKLNEPDFGASSNVVVRLTRNIPAKKNHKIFFDNYYTAIPLMEYLFSRGIHSLGTVRLPRLPNCPLPDKKNEKKMKRGESIEYITSYESAPISAVIWKDNKAVKLVSTYCGELPKTKVKRFDRSKKKEIEIDCPQLVTEYNHNMGGVDLLDSHIGRYKIKFRSRKWYMRLFYHLIDLTVVNSWCLYKRVQESKNDGNKIIELAVWRKILAHSLINSGEVRHSGRGRPSMSVEKKIASTRPQSVRPTKSIRTDNTNHWPTFTDKRERCKMPQCKGFTFVKCTKCSVNLCFNKNHNCFMNYHVQ